MLRYTIGDATAPEGAGPRIIAHVTNNLGAWGAGFSGALSRRWPVLSTHYRGLGAWPLGSVGYVAVEDGLVVANMIAQSGLRSRSNPRPLHYPALHRCLDALRDHAQFLGASVHMPRIGTGLAGGTWAEVETLVQRYLVGHGVEVTVYDLAGGR